MTEWLDEHPELMARREPNLWDSLEPAKTKGGYTRETGNSSYYLLGAKGLVVNVRKEYAPNLPNALGQCAAEITAVGSCRLTHDDSGEGHNIVTSEHGNYWKVHLPEKDRGRVAAICGDHKRIYLSTSSEGVGLLLVPTGEWSE